LEQSVLLVTASKASFAAASAAAAAAVDSAALQYRYGSTALIRALLSSLLTQQCVKLLQLVIQQGPCCHDGISARLIERAGEHEVQLLLLLLLL
jgi:hypothetical protein